MYITDDGSETMDKDKALVCIDEDVGGIGFLVKASYEGLLLSGKRYKLDTARLSKDSQLFAYLHNDDAPERSNPPYRPKPSQPPTVPSTSTSPAQKTATKMPESLPSIYVTSDLPDITEQPKAKKHTSKKATKKSQVENNNNVNIGVKPSTIMPIVLDSENSRSSIDSVSSVRIIPPRPNSQKSIASLTSESQDTDSQPLPTIDFTLNAGTFEIVLVMDNREVFGAGASKDTLLTELKKNRVPLEVRPLSIGDFVWIARPKTGIFHTVDKAEELILDHIIERKRMDDLASSIVDGRFKEQKFRLCNCGLKRPIYLVEDYGSIQHFSINQDALNQAVVNTQIIDNFYVKRTRDVKESVAYLTIMTRYLQSLYGHKTLHACSKKELNHLSLATTVTDSEARLITYQEFDKLSVKSRKLTVQETFGKQLVQINGITVEKAAAIVEKYKTPKSLIEAFKKCTTEKQKETMLVSIKFGALNRNLGPQLSKVIYWLYSRNALS